MPRTKEEFDTWFRSKGGDPWGYAGDFVQHRFDRSIEFVQENVPAAFSGAFAELGAFNGDFSVRLARAYPQAQIVCNDISEVALEQARAKAAGLPNVVFDLSDLATFQPPSDLRERDFVLLIMEALYYLGKDEQGPALDRLVTELRRPLVFLSGPVHGDDHSSSHLSESSLTALLAKRGYAAPVVRVLNWTDELRILMDGKTDAEYAETSRRLDADYEFRQRYGRQVMYCFKPG